MTATMVDTAAPRSTRRNTYLIVALVFIALAVLALLFSRPARATAAAEDRANQLIAALEEAGVEEPPSQDRIVSVLGEDGGAICADPNNALKRGLFYSEASNGAGGPGARPVISDRVVVAGEALVIGIYCPDELPEFNEFVKTMAFDNVINR